MKVDEKRLFEEFLQGIEMQIEFSDINASLIEYSVKDYILNFAKLSQFSTVEFEQEERFSKYLEHIKESKISLVAFIEFLSYNFLNLQRECSNRIENRNYKDNTIFSEERDNESEFEVSSDENEKLKKENSELKERISFLEAKVVEISEINKVNSCQESDTQNGYVKEVDFSSEHSVVNVSVIISPKEEPTQETSVNQIVSKQLYLSKEVTVSSSNILSSFFSFVNDLFVSSEEKAFHECYKKYITTTPYFRDKDIGGCIPSSYKGYFCCPQVVHVPEFVPGDQIDFV